MTLQALVSPVVENAEEELAGLVDRNLREIGKKRRVAVSVPHFFLAPLIVAESNYIMTVAENVAIA